MPNFSCETSSLLKLPKDKIPRALEIIKEVQRSNAYELISIEALPREDGVWFWSDYLIVEELIKIVQAILLEFQIYDPFVFSWAYSSTKPLLDSFDGGACVIKLGHEPYVIWSAQDLANRHFQ